MPISRPPCWRSHSFSTSFILSQTSCSRLISFLLPCNYWDSASAWLFPEDNVPGILFWFGSCISLFLITLRSTISRAASGQPSPTPAPCLAQTPRNPACYMRKEFENWQLSHWRSIPRGARSLGNFLGRNWGIVGPVSPEVLNRIQLPYVSS